MGQKVHPKGLRVGIIKDWDVKWFAKKGYAKYIYEDYQIRKFIKDQLKNAGVANIEIERIADRVRITIQCSRPGIVIGRKGSEVNKLKEAISKLISGDIQLKITEVKSPELNAQLVAENIAEQLERKGSTKRAMRQAANRALKAGAEGIKISCAGRIGGAEIARTEWHLEGRLPLHTLRADIDYGFTEANTTYGKIGVKVWIFNGEVLSSNNSKMKVKTDSQKILNTEEKEEEAQDYNLEGGQSNATTN
ncbi:MAG: 30S ribosomal protein S3 [Candidatus Caldatribacteriota bacterium]